MKKPVVMLIIFGMMWIIILNTMTMAASSAVQIVSVPVATITSFTTSGNPSVLAINMAVPGFQPDNAVNAETTYNISTNESNKKITAMLNCNMPANTYLKIRLVAPNEAMSMGDVTLSTMPADLVTGISKVAESGKKITYTFSSTVAVGMIASGMRTVVLTVTNE